jgi:hypothetical protein
LKSAGQPQLSVSTDKSALAADGQDIAHLEISLRDANGVLFNLADDEITVSVSGAGVLAGLGSSNPSTETRFDSSVVSAFDGRALAIVRATGAGEISVTLSTAAHGSKTISIIAA